MRFSCQLRRSPNCSSILEIDNKCRDPQFASSCNYVIIIRHCDTCRLLYLRRSSQCRYFDVPVTAESFFLLATLLLSDAFLCMKFVHSHLPKYFSITSLTLWLCSTRSLFLAFTCRPIVASSFIVSRSRSYAIAGPSVCNVHAPYSGD